MYLPYLTSHRWSIIPDFVSTGNCTMQPKMKPLTVNWCNGPNGPNKKQRHVHTFFIDTTQRWICSIAALCTIVVF